MPYLKEKGSFYGYLQQTARNMVIDRARSMKRRGIHVTIDDEESMPLPDTNTVEPYFEIFEIEDEKLLKQALASLNEDQRKVWELRMQNISFKDIAEMENCSLNTALARMNYAKKNIKLYIETHS